MQDAVDTTPLREHAHQCTDGKSLTAVRGGQQRNSSPLACGRYQNIEATRRKARLDRYGTGVPVVRRKMPDVATLLLLMEDGKLGKLRWCRRFAFLRQEGWTCDKDPPTYADPLHLQVSVGVKAFANPDRHVDSFLNEIDPPIGYDALEPQQRMGCKEARHGSNNRALEAERAAQSNKPARLSLHSKRGLLSSFSLDDGGTRMLEDLLADLSQTESSRRSIKQPYAKPLLQQRYAPTDPRFWYPERAGGG